MAGDALFRGARWFSFRLIFAGSDAGSLESAFSGSCWQNWSRCRQEGPARSSD